MFSSAVARTENSRQGPEPIASNLAGRGRGEEEEEEEEEEEGEEGEEEEMEEEGWDTSKKKKKRKRREREKERERERERERKNSQTRRVESRAIIGTPTDKRAGCGGRLKPHTSLSWPPATVVVWIPD